MKKKLYLLAILILAAIFISCYTPSPLYGTWADNTGSNTIKFMQDGTFNAKIQNADGKPETVEGNYSVIDNIIVFNIIGDVTYSRNSEWDIRGAMLYLTWYQKDSDKSINLTLYHIAR